MSLGSRFRSVGIDPHEPVSGPVLGPDAEHARLELLAILHLHRLGEVGDAPGVVILGVRLRHRHLLGHILQLANEKLVLGQMISMDQ